MLSLRSRLRSAKPTPRPLPLAARILGLGLVPIFLPPQHAPFRMACRGNRVGLLGRTGRLLLARVAGDVASGGPSEEATGQSPESIASSRGQGG